MLDSVILGSHQGRLGDEQVGWLDSALAQEPDKPTIVAVHHPPFRTGIDWMDALELQDQADFAEVIRRSPQVQRVVSGHLHRAITCQWAGTTALTAPSVTYQVSLDLALDAAACYFREPPAILLHVLTNGHLVTRRFIHHSGPEPDGIQVSRGVVVWADSCRDDGRDVAAYVPARPSVPGWWR